jgi:pimeloyl-ACP methyl ester carboxylesterase
MAGLMASQDRALMLAAWRETMAFDSRSRLAVIDGAGHALIRTHADEFLRVTGAFLG